MIRLLIVGFLDWLLDRLDGGPAEQMQPRCWCPVCGETVADANPHLHGCVVVTLTEWPTPGALVTVESG